MIAPSGRCADVPVQTVLHLTSLPLRGWQNAAWLCSPFDTAQQRSVMGFIRITSGRRHRQRLVNVE